MSSAPTATDPAASTAAKPHFDPEEHRMTLGEHLEELRKRLLLGFGGFILAFIGGMILGDRVVWFVCKPLFVALARNGQPPQIFFTDPAEVFMTYIKAAMISAFAVAGPWMLYQLWLFVAAGLYPHERKTVTKYLPLSLALLIGGMVFLYTYVLPLMLEFFMKFSIGVPPYLGDEMGFKVPPPIPVATAPAGASPGAAVGPLVLPLLAEDPKDPVPGSVWINAKAGFIKICIAAGKFRTIQFGSESATTPMITLGTYFATTIGMMIAFGLAFQLPLVVLTLARIGIVSIETLKNLRRVVYFSLAIVAAVIVPDVVTGMLALLIPLILLYEMGILMAQWTTRKGTLMDGEAGTTP
ncbi:MAG TPA: twin-arginine translocase subunit TatC [Tepidisphaeraceae bacterium]|nr:twin-arginine translocase subunit TatC [Tepidisphaeraceae bacterium]